jgi:glycosyltransferase involved in cell wall biosynthesis
VQPQLSIIVPVYNEEATLPAIMQAIADACKDAQVIYVDDGSRDGSLTLLHARKRPQDVVLSKQNGGKGSAIRLGLAHASAEYTVIQDADLEYDPKEIELLLKTAQAHGNCAVFGSRFLRKNPNIYKRFLLGNKFMTGCLNVLFHAHLTDSYTCYKLLPTSTFQALALVSNGFELEAEIAGKALKSGMEIIEVPISYRPRSIAEGKKIGWRDVLRGLRMMLHVRFGT